MSFRGWRGGGGRGGRGGWGRGRGGAGAAPGPVARDDDGNILAVDKPEGPPPLFPPIKSLPELPEISQKDEQLLHRRRRLNSAWKYSPYQIEKPKKKAVGVTADVERYSDRYRLAHRQQRAPLSSVLKLTVAYFPAELLGNYTATRGKAKAGGRTPWIHRQEDQPRMTFKDLTSWPVWNRKWRRQEIRGTRMRKRKKVMKMRKRKWRKKKLR
eukprot:TRINITY_DN9412_c0_g1_i1.p1 TRINITY_DN9412_c0_g1~~TRINITY_DN9412_c0_g1_i1.p1  ORF type:complete len:212 (+),score=39.43 TRINITY_DN9412_c0_g1_i1:108-743(+)